MARQSVLILRADKAISGRSGRITPPSGPRTSRRAAGVLASGWRRDGRPPVVRAPQRGPLFCFLFSRVARIQDTTKRVRVNKQIRISPIRVIAADGAQLGIMDVETALAAAIEQGLDLVEVAPMARPPVARIMDYGKLKFEQAKMARKDK